MTIAEQKKVLVCHYYGALGNGLARLLQHHGYDARYLQVDAKIEASTLAEDIERENVDLVFLSLDFGSPLHNENRGLEALVELRKRSKVPVAILSSDNSHYSLIDMAVACLRGAQGFVILPDGVTGIGQMADSVIEIATKKSKISLSPVYPVYVTAHRN